MEKPGRFLLALLLLSALCAAAWNQTVMASARDAAGQPVPGAELKIAYQKDSNSTLDGTVLGRTDGNGSFFASLTNSVSASFENRKITVTLWTYYWEGQEQSVLAGQPGAEAVSFQIPYVLEKVYVNVTAPDGKPADGAAVSIYGTSVEAAAGSDGIAVLVIPQGLSFSGFATLGAQSSLFTSDEISLSGGKKTVAVALPAAQQAPSPPPARPVFRATLAGTDGLPLANQALTIEADGRNASMATGSGGNVSFRMEKPGALRIYVLYHEYGYEFGYQVEADRNETIALKPQIRIDAFAAEKDTVYCYNVTARVSDPRPSLPIQVTIVRYAGNASYPQATSLDESGRFAARVCASGNSTVAARASNKYESVESAPLELKASAPGPNAGTPVQNKPPAAGGGQGLPAALIIALAAVAAVVAALFFLARKQAGTLFRFINEYLRTIYKVLAGRRHRGPPPVIPPEQV